ncbi:hypothetical protein BH18ACT1_BH18ACT1_11940 [soil metagenome]
MTGLFIVSTGRTGTQFLAELFGRLGARASHEPGPRWLRLASNAHASGRLSTRRASKLLERVRGEDLRAEGAPPWVESSCLVYGLVEPLLATFGAPSVVQVVRDPRTYVRSGLGWGAYRTGGRVLNVVPFRRLAPPQFRPRSLSTRVEWARQGQFERLCWAWMAMNRAMRTQGAGDLRFSVVRFEDLFDPQRSCVTLRDLCTRAGVEADGALLDEAAERRVNAGKRPETPDWSQWSPEERRFLVDTCGEEAAAYGYRLDAEDEALVTP